jgi:prevent-host-death family protein
MKLAEQVRPISYFKAHAPEVISALAENHQPVVITLNGEARAVLQDIASFEQTQETLALLKILALSNKSVEVDKVAPVDQAFARIRETIRA